VLDLFEGQRARHCKDPVESLELPPRRFEREPLGFEDIELSPARRSPDEPEESSLLGRLFERPERVDSPDPRPL
jgi:hypothetical protein